MSVIDRELRLPSSDPGIELAGVEARNAHSPARAKLLLVAGSGPQDRDQTVAGLPTFKLLRDALAEAGFAALSFDRRGVGDSDGSWLDGSGAREIEDLLAAARRWTDAEPKVPLFLIGHSQGGLFALEAAPRVPELAGLVLLATSGRPGRETLETQHRRICALEGWDDAAIEDSLALKQACFDLLQATADPRSGDETVRLRDRLQQIVDNFYRVRGVAPETLRDELDAMIDDLMEWEWRYLLRADPAACRGIAVPVFIATGSRDVQTEPAVDPALLSNHLEGVSTTIVVVRDANHLFQVEGRETEGARDRAEAPLGPPMDPTLLGPLIEWLSSQLGDDSSGHSTNRSRSASDRR
jgi:pimeloyl-ACP methyl ester carboxylesterase